jgi:hypothetical protein
MNHLYIIGVLQWFLVSVIVISAMHSEKCTTKPILLRVPLPSWLALLKYFNTRLETALCRFHCH